MLLLFLNPCYYPSLSNVLKIEPKVEFARPSVNGFAFELFKIKIKN